MSKRKFKKVRHRSDVMARPSFKKLVKAGQQSKSDDSIIEMTEGVSNELMTESHVHGEHCNH